MNNILITVRVADREYRLNIEREIVGKISWSLVPGLVYIQVPEKYQDQYMTVIKIKLKDKVHLYRGEGGLDI
jgi:alpha-L-fucosidase